MWLVVGLAPEWGKRLVGVVKLSYALQMVALTVQPHVVTPRRRRAHAERSMAPSIDDEGVSASSSSCDIALGTLLHCYLFVNLRCFGVNCHVCCTVQGCVARPRKQALATIGSLELLRGVVWKWKRY